MAVMCHIKGELYYSPGLMSYEDMHDFAIHFRSVDINNLKKIKDDLNSLILRTSNLLEPDLLSLLVALEWTFQQLKNLDADIDPEKNGYLV